MKTTETKKPFVTRKPGDAINIEHITMLIVGQPYIGKTTLGFGAGSPECNGDDVLLIDFDGGFYRAKNIRENKEVNSWTDVANISTEELKPYKSIVIDTVGTALDYIAADVIDNDIKFVHSKKDGTLSQNGFGALKAAFTTWIKRIRGMGKDIVILAHDKELGMDDKKYIRADIMGGSYNEITRKADAIGYLYLEETKDRGNIRILDFNPCKQWLGKNPGDYPPMEVPGYIEEPFFLNRIISEIKEKLTKKATSQVEEEMKVGEFITRIRKAETVDALNQIHADMKVQLNTLSPILKKQIWSALIKQADTKHAAYHEVEKVFYSTLPQTESTEQTDPEPPVETKQDPVLPTEPKKNGTPPPIVEQPQATEVQPPVNQQPTPEVKQPEPVAEQPKAPAVKEEKFKF